MTDKDKFLNWKEISQYIELDWDKVINSKANAVTKPILRAEL